MAISFRAHPSRPPTHPARKCALVAPRFGTLRRYHAVVHAGLGRFGDTTQDGTWWYKAWSQVLVGCWLVHAYCPALLCQSVTLASILLFLVTLAVHGTMRRNTFWQGVGPDLAKDSETNKAQF